LQVSSLNPRPLFPTAGPARLETASVTVKIRDTGRYSVGFSKCCGTDDSLTLLGFFVREEPAIQREVLAYVRGRDGIIERQTVRGRLGYFLDDGRSWIYMWSEQGCTYRGSSRYGFDESLSKAELLAMLESMIPLPALEVDPDRRMARSAGHPCQPPETPKTIGRVYFPSRCVNQAYRPRTVVVACGDGNLVLTRMRWSGWNRKSTAGRGIARANDCQPYCAAGKFRSYRVRATLSGRTVCGDGSLQYTKLRYRILGLGRGGSVPFPCPA